MKPTVFLVNNRDAIVDLSMIKDTLGKPVTLQPRGLAGDCRECPDVVANHTHVKAVVNAGWVSIKVAELPAPPPPPAPKPEPVVPPPPPPPPPAVVEEVAEAPVEVPVVQAPPVEAPVQETRFKKRRG